MQVAVGNNEGVGQHAVSLCCAGGLAPLWLASLLGCMDKDVFVVRLSGAECFEGAGTSALLDLAPFCFKAEQ